MGGFGITNRIFELMFEHHFQCPYCWETISMLIDLSLTSENYIEDCEVCCRPIKINYKPSTSGESKLRVQTLDE